MKRNLLWVALLFAGTASAFAQVITTSTPEAAGFSSERLKRIDVAMNDWVSKGYLNGASALIIRNGKVAYYKAAGYDDLDTKSPMPKDGIFRIASQSKAITSVAIMILFEEGKLLLSDPVSTYIPSYKGQSVLAQLNAADTTYTTVPAKREVTIKDLLTHTSGVGYAQIGTKEANAIYNKAGLTTGIGVSHESLLTAMTRLGKLPLMHQPGEKWTYGLNDDILGAVVEVISGMSLDDFFRTRIFEPLGMKDTYFNVPQAKADRLVNLYTEKADGTLVKAQANMLNNGPVTSRYPLIKTSYFSGGAGLSSSIYDYAIFLQMLLNNGEYNGKRILSRNSVRMMTTNQVGEVPISNEDKFGLGFQVVTDKSSGRTPAQAGTFGWGGAFGTSYWVDPKEKMVLLIYRQMQARTHNEVIEKFRAMAYGALNE
ncbi:serine hydrolase domain-containing protein [Daejeonella sp.]|uniref:serine hydrolase domain-containing protein n=1 Tax=Daejeonella sp. TaxID=2805397 RepID=UPI0030BD8887